jgi:uncharacterized protein
LAVRFSLDGCTALITGASSGLGSEFARQLAHRADCLILVARREQLLQSLRDDLLRTDAELKVIVCPADISSQAGRDELLHLVKIRGLPLNVLINNAGLGDYGSFSDSEPQRIQQQIDVNITGLVQLTRSFIPVLRENQPSGILNVSSLAASLPLPALGVYAATKAFVSSFSESLRIELMDAGIQVAALCPGPTPTSFSQTARREKGMDIDRSGQDVLTVSPHVVVQQGLAALVRNSATVHPGFGVALAARTFRHVPRWILRALLLRRWRQSQPNN